MASRIISAEELGTVEPFSLGALPNGPQSPLRQRANMRAQPDKDDALRQAFELGYRKGVEAGRAAVEQQVRQEQQALGATLRQRVERLAGALEDELQSFQHDGAERVIDLAIEVARQTVRDTVHSRRETILPVVQEALGHLDALSSGATLHLNPADVELVSTELAAMLARRHIEVRADPAIALGGCRLLGGALDVDATLATRWQRTLAAMGRPDPLAEHQDDPFGHDVPGGPAPFASFENRAADFTTPPRGRS